jgi:hypothetical protein
LQIPPPPQGFLHRQKQKGMSYDAPSIQTVPIFPFRTLKKFDSKPSRGQDEFRQRRQARHIYRTTQNKI